MTLKITAFVCPYDYWHDSEQTYCQEGLRLSAAMTEGQCIRLSLSRFPKLMRVLRRLRDSYRLQWIVANRKYLALVLDKIAEAIAGPIRTPSQFFHSLVGQYLFESKERKEWKVCIDTSDSNNVSHQGLVEWSDIYFKTNVWRGKHYPDKVLPIFDGDPRVLGHIPRLRSYRTMEKRYDLCFLVRVWGGTNETEGVEHNVRMLEAVARAKCSKFVLAYLVAGDIPGIARRLADSGIPSTTRPTPVGELWRLAAQSQLTVMRLGMHYCISWGMTAALAMGGCPVLDRPPYTVWPHPLLENDNFLSLDLDVGPEKPVASDDQYRAIPSKIADWLSDSERVNRIGHNNSDYFDRFLAPEKVGGYIRGTVAKRMESETVRG